MALVLRLLRVMGGATIRALSRGMAAGRWAERRIVRSELRGQRSWSRSMKSWVTRTALVIAAGAFCAGCKEGPFAPSVTQQSRPAAVFPQPPPQSPALASQVNDLKGRMGQLDMNN